MSAGVAFDTGSGVEGSGTSFNWAHTVTGANTLLLVSVSVDNQSNSNAAATYNGVAMTRIANLSAQQYLGHFSLAAPAAGSNLVAVTFTGGPEFGAGAQSFTNVAQTGGVGTPVTSEGLSTSTSSNVPAVPAGGMAADAVSINNEVASNLAPGGGQAKDCGNAGSVSATLDEMSHESGSGTVVMSWTWVASTRYAQSAVALSPVPGTVSFRPPNIRPAPFRPGLAR